MTLLELLGLVKKNLKLVVILPLVCAIGMGTYAFVGMEDEYTATASMYVLAKQDEIGNNLNTNLSASQMVANDVATLLKSDRVRDLAALDLGVKSLAGFEIAVVSYALMGSPRSAGEACRHAHGRGRRLPRPHVLRLPEEGRRQVRVG